LAPSKNQRSERIEKHQAAQAALRFQLPEKRLRNLLLLAPWKNLKDLQDSTAMLALHVTLLTISRKPETFGRTALWAVFQRFCESIDFIQAQLCSRFL
jgi:hypothetical protein